MFDVSFTNNRNLDVRAYHLGIASCRAEMCVIWAVVMQRKQQPGAAGLAKRPKLLPVEK